MQRLKNAILAVCCMALMGGCVFPWAASRQEPAPEQFVQTSAPVSPRAQELLERAKALWDENDHCLQAEDATAWLDAALQVEPDFAEALLWRGRALTEGGYLEDAFDDLTRSIRIQATALAYASRGLVGLRLGNFEGAERDLAAALALDPSEPHAYLYRSALYFLREEPESACADLEAACDHGMCEPLRNAVSEGLCPSSV